MARISSKPAAPQTKPAGLRNFHLALLRWYKTHGRHDLPWRNTEDAYHIWLSEVMLQQTQVATVRERFYPPFLKKFPTIEALAAAPPEAVMKAWEGLGYYSRARNLHKAAVQLAGNAKTARMNKASLPAEVSELIALPGIGRNTASAIAAFAYHQPVAILEANVKRIVARIFALETPTDEQLWSGADALLNSAHPFDHNQAMMDLGAMVCIPKKPDCPNCPANRICEGKHAPESYPQKKAKKAVPTRHVNIMVARDTAGRFYLEQRSDKLLGGLWGFPQSPSTITTAGDVTHIHSHFRLEGHLVETLEKMKNPRGGWYSKAEIATLPISKLDHKVLALIDKTEAKPPVRHAQKRHTADKPAPKPRRTAPKR